MAWSRLGLPLAIATGSLGAALAEQVIVVGAGMSGLSAAAALERQGIEFVVLEARNYTGGRMHSQLFGSPSVGEHYIEVCANWIQGGEPNPLLQAARRIGLRMAKEPGTDQNFSNYVEVFDSQGSPVDISNRSADLDYINTCVRNLAESTYPNDMTLRDALTQCNWVVGNEVDAGLDFFSFQGEFAISADRASLIYNLPDRNYEAYEDDDYFVCDQHPRGYARIVDELTLPLGDPRVLLGAEVVSLRYGADGVTAILKDGREFAGAAAVVTAPVGVLKARHATLFDPPMPEAQAQALMKYTMANFTKIHMQWAEPFWRDVPRWMIAGDIPSWWNLNHESVIPGSNMLMAWTDGPEGSRYEEMPDEEVQRTVLERLRKVYPEAPEPVAFHITRHGSEEFQLGAYSAWEFGLSAEEWNLAHAPLGGRVFFAGEAWCRDRRPFTQGAFFSGERAVNKWVLPSLGLQEGPLTPCDETTSAVIVTVI